MELFPKHLQKKVQYSVNLLRKAEKLAKAYDPDNGYYLAFSGGKDSQALYHVARLAGVQFKAHMNFTSVDPADVIRFVRREYPDVHTIPPKDSIYNIAIRMRLLPTRRARWCCKEFKESAGAGKVTLIGIRLAESFRRSKRNQPPQWQKDLARWANRKEIFRTCDFKDFSPRKGFVCKEYFR